MVARPASFLVLAGVVAACSAGSATSGGLVDGGGGDGSGSDGGGSDGATGTDGAAADSSFDGGVVVHEGTAPACHDLAHAGAPVSVVANSGSPPTATPLPSLEPGLYVVTSVIEYGTSTTTEPSNRTTIYVTPTRYYFLYDAPAGTGPARHDIITTNWALDAGTLKRTVLCTSQGSPGQNVEHRVDTSAGGFTLYALSAASRPIGIQYVKVK